MTTEEVTPGGLSRKKRVRGEHKASANRIITQMYEAKESAEEGESVITKLMQCKLSLQGKLDTVIQLYDEILELIDNAEVDEEIEQADIFKEKLQQAIIDANITIEAGRTDRVPLSMSVTDRAATAPLATVKTEVPSTSVVSTVTNP